MIFFGVLAAVPTLQPTPTLPAPNVRAVQAIGPAVPGTAALPQLGALAAPPGVPQGGGAQAPEQLAPRLFDGVPADFGAKNGSPIANKDAILPAVDAALGVSRPPALEYIWVRPLATKKVAGFKLGPNPYGHSALRYTMPDGTQKVMNIVGAAGRELVNFMKPQDYLYGTDNFDEGSEQGGVYNRGMVSVRIERLPDEAILKLDRYFKVLDERSERGYVKFQLAFSDVMNALGAILPGHQAEKGNCARWTTMGLCAAGIMRAPSLWPKKVWIDLFKSARKADPSNVHVVVYRRVAHAALTYGIPGEPAGLVAPFRWLLHRRYWDLEKFADAIVEVPEGATTAQVRRVERRRPAGKARP